MGKLIKELAKKLIDENPPEPPKDHDIEKLKRLAEIKEAFRKHRRSLGRTEK